MPIREPPAPGLEAAGARRHYGRTSRPGGNIERPHAACSFICLACFCDFSGHHRRAAADDLKLIEGNWIIHSEECDDPAALTNAAEYRLAITGTNYVARSGDRSEAGLIRITPSANPKTLDVVAGEDGSTGKVFRCIYKVDSDTLTVCGPNDPAGNRPTAFAFEKGSNLRLVVFKRLK